LALQRRELLPAGQGAGRSENGCRRVPDDFSGMVSEGGSGCPPGITPVSWRVAGLGSD
jgi:hypothetical protein